MPRCLEDLFSVSYERASGGRDVDYLLGKTPRGPVLVACVFSGVSHY